MFKFVKKAKYVAYLSQVIENIEETLKGQAQFMDMKNSYLITSMDFQRPLKDYNTLEKAWGSAENEIRVKAASVMNMKLMKAIDYASECNRNNVKLIEEIIELQNNEDLMKRIDAVGQSSAEIDNSAEISAIEEDFGVILEGFSRNDYYSKISHDIFSDLNRYPKFDE